MDFIPDAREDVFIQVFNNLNQNFIFEHLKDLKKFLIN